MVRIIVYTIVVILCSSLVSFLLYALGEDVYPVASTREVTAENTPPPISRNPFVSVPYGRMDKTISISETNPKVQKADKMKDHSKGLKLKGILLDGDYPVALVGNRIVKIGDKVDEFEVTDITPAGVSLTKGDQVIKLAIE